MKSSEPVARIARYCARHPWRILAVAAILTLLSGFAAIHLPVHTSRQALLPQDAPVARRMNAYLEKFGAASDLMVVIEGAPRPELESFASDLAARLRKEPEIRQVTERLDPAFFLNHAWLLMPARQLGQLQTLLESPGARKFDLGQALQGIETAATGSKAPDASPAEAAAGLRILDALLAEWQRWLQPGSPPAGLDWTALSAAAGAQGLGNGYFASRNGQMLVLFVQPGTASGGFEVLQPFYEKVNRVARQLADEYRTAGRTAPGFGLTGLPAIEYEEHIDIDRDIRLVIWSAAGLIGALILLVVRSLRWAVAIFVPMGLGAVWSLGLAWLSVGHLTIITSSFLAILFGLGADYGIFTSSRIAEERAAGKPLIDAIGVGIASSFPALLTAGGASLLIFGALATLDFPGFAELGLIAAGGVLLILISTWFVQPALYALLPPRLKTRPAARTDTLPSAIPGAYPRSVALILVVLALAGAVAGGAMGVRIPFDYDVLSLLPADSRAAGYQRRLVAETDYQSEVVIFTAPDMEEARRITQEAGKLGTIARVQSMTDFFPPDAAGRMETAWHTGAAAASGKFAQRLEAMSGAGISPAEFDRLEGLLALAMERIDSVEEQAFSSGHSELVGPLDTARASLEFIHQQLKADPAKGRERTERFYRHLLTAAQDGFRIIEGWRSVQPLTPAGLPATLRDRFFAADGSIAVYAFPAQSVYDPDNLDRLVEEVYRVSPDATGFPTTHQVFSKAVVSSFSRGTLLAVAVGLGWLVLALRNVQGVILAALPLLIGGGWMLGLMALGGLRYNYANIIALPLVIALAVDYGVWYSHRWRELRGLAPLSITLNAGRVIALAAGTELAGLGAITLASYRGVSSLGVDITVGLLCCLSATLLIAPAIGQLTDMRKP